MSNARLTSTLRLAGVASFFALHLVLGGLYKLPSWQGNWDLFLVYLIASAGLFFAARNSDNAANLTHFAVPLIDMPMVFILQWMSLPTSNQAGVAGFTIALFVLMVSLAALSLSHVTLLTAALMASVLLSVLQQIADVGLGASLSSVVVILMTVLLWFYGNRRLSVLAQRVVDDLEKRQRAEVALKQSEASFRRLIDESPEVIWVFSGQKVIHANRHALISLGYVDTAEFQQYDFTDIFGMEDIPTRDWVSQVFGFTAAPPACEIQLRRRDGQFLILEMVALPVVFEGKSSVIAVGHDVSERKALQASLIFADRMTSMGVVAAGIAHEINGPLSYISSNLEYIQYELAKWGAKEGNRAPTEVIAAASEALIGASRVKFIVQDLKGLSRMDAEDKELLDLRAIVESSLRMASGLIRERAQVVKELEMVPLVEVNGSRMGQVFLNLLINAAQSISPGASSQHAIKVVARSDATHVIAEVHDTGAGIPSNVLPRIFEPFFTTKAKGIGTGLGLPICESIVRSYGGSLEVESVVGKGSIFRVRLPAIRSTLNLSPT